MPFVSTKSSEQQTVIHVNGLLDKIQKLKNDVNTALLREHCRSAELTNTLVCVEDQVREATELALKSLRQDIERKRKKVLAGIKRLQDSLYRYTFY